MGAMASQITSITTVYSTVYSGADQRKLQSSTSLAVVRGSLWWPVNSLHKWPGTRKMFPFDDVIMFNEHCVLKHVILANNKKYPLKFTRDLSTTCVYPEYHSPSFEKHALPSCLRSFIHFSLVTSSPVKIIGKSPHSWPKNRYSWSLMHYYSLALNHRYAYVIYILVSANDIFLKSAPWHAFPSQHNDVIKWKPFPRYWPFVRGIHLSPVSSPHKGQWRRALMFPLICAWINGWVNNREAGDLRRYRAHYDVPVMSVFTYSPCI